jgi:acetyltransferase-like isoleucine patch superfamily enzyme
MNYLLHFYNMISFFLPSRAHFLRSILLKTCGVSLGENVCFNGMTYVYGNYLEIGENTWLGIGSVFFTNKKGKIWIGKNVDIGPAACLVTGSHNHGNSNRRAGFGNSQPIKIGDGCWIGANTTVLGGAIIDRGCIIAAGSLVMPGKYPENVLLAGVPATIKKQL